MNTSSRRRPRDQKSADDLFSYCSAAIAFHERRDNSHKCNKFRCLDGYDAILTWLDALSMVRAAFEGDGASFPSTQASFRVSAAWLKARKTAEMEVAINRPPTKPRFPQGSEVWITGCPKLRAAAKSGLTSPETSRTRLRPRHPPWLSGFASPPSWLPVFLSERLSAGGSIACCRLRPGASSY